MDSSSSSDSEREPHLSQAEMIKKKKESKKRKRDKLLQQLEKRKKRQDWETACHNKASAFQSRKPSGRGRHYTLSVALPGSILDNAQSPELRTYLGGQIARALAVFNVDEVIIFDDERTSKEATKKTTDGEFDGIGKHGQGCLQLARILQFLECPQYLRKAFFPIHKDLKYAGVLNPTDMPHHLRATEKSEFREGVVLDRPPTKRGSLVNVGLQKDMIVDKILTPGLRVTVRLDPEQTGSKIYGSVVSPSTPRVESGMYWGYSVRLAESLSAVFAGTPYKEGYDLSVGTSERGVNVDDCQLDEGFQHLLVVFGGVRGLEAALEVDEKLEGDDPEPLFDRYLNTCPQQGSRTIRTEEAVLVTLAALRPKIGAAQKIKQ